MSPLAALLATVGSMRLRKERTDDESKERFAAALGLDTLMATELAQFHTFAVPKISALLARTGQYEEPGTRRLDDTKLLLSPVLNEGSESETGSEAIAQVNRIHAQYKIDNDEYLYVLSTFVFVAEEFYRTFSWREARPDEEADLYARVLDMGQAMNIEGIPDDIDEFRRWTADYLAQNRNYHPDNHTVAEGMMRGVKSSVPAPMRPLVSPLTRVLLNDEDLLEALGYTLPPAPFVALVRAAMAARKRLSKYVSSLNKREFFDLYLVQSAPSRPNGFSSYADLGPVAIRAKLDRQDAKGAPSACTRSNSPAQ